MKTHLQSLIDSAKRNCNMCHTYRNLTPKENYQLLAQDATKNAYNKLKEAFNDLRQNDAPPSQLDKVREVKTLCLDAIDSCRTCDKERPRIKEALIGIK